MSRGPEGLLSALDLMLWGLLHCEGSATGRDRAELEFSDGTEIVVPLAGHLPDTTHPHWPAARDELEAVRAAAEHRTMKQRRALRLLTARMHCAVEAAADPRRPVPPHFPTDAAMR